MLTCYDQLHMGIVIVDPSLDVVFMNSWFLKRVPWAVKVKWEAGETINLKMLFILNGNQDADAALRLEAVIQKTVRHSSVQVLSQAFHKWLIPLYDQRFEDGRMRQTCIVQPHKCFHGKNNGSYNGKANGKANGNDNGKANAKDNGKATEKDNDDFNVLIQIKDESDTVLKSANLRKSREKITDKNRELTRLNEELQQREAHIRQKSKMEAMGRMAGGIAHDFNNYLAVILGNTELLMDEIYSGDPCRSMLEEMKSASLKARDVIRQILIFSRPDIDEDYGVTINPDTVIREIIPLLRTLVPRSINFDYCCHDIYSSHIMATPSQLQRILVNLIVNAVHAVTTSRESKNDITRGSILISLSHIAIKGDETGLNFSNKDDPSAPYHLFNPLDNSNTFKTGKYIILDVKDNGHGISHQHLEKIFDPYFTTKDVGEGSGIGLSVVHGLVSRLKGGIRVESQVGKGTGFTILFPEATK
ncbi:MAG: hypothetical protein HQK66_10325 [Desulfamplus sp.]|nr:hypothetical protein [Desulfamplus sp.]